MNDDCRGSRHEQREKVFVRKGRGYTISAACKRKN